MNSFGKCDCGGNLQPVWFEENETIEYRGFMHTTGKKRKCLSHLICDKCLSNVIINGEFDETQYT